MLYQHYKLLRDKPEVSIRPKVLQYQLIIMMLMLITGVTSLILVLTGKNTSEIENIVEWNFSLLVNLYFAGMILIWKDCKHVFMTRAAKK